MSKIVFFLKQMLRERINTDQHKYQMLYSIIVDEMSKQMIKENNSATLAILWIKRYDFVIYMKLRKQKIFLYK